MILNIDLGNLYLKASVLDPNKKLLVTSEIIKVERDISTTVIEVLLTTIIESYSKQYNIRKVNIIPNMKYIDCELLDYEAIVESKYDKVMQASIKNKVKEEKAKAREDYDYSSETLKKKVKFTEIPFTKPLLNKSIFHNIESQTLTTSKIYVEYIDSAYLKDLTNIIRKVGKDISLISPIKALKYLPFPKKDRIIVNYGDNHCIALVIENVKGKDVIKEIIKKNFNEDSSRLSDKILAERHELATLDNVLYRSIFDEIKELERKYKKYLLCFVGGNSNYLINDFLTSNKLEFKFNGPPIPRVIETLILPSMVLNYGDLTYNNLGLHIKNNLSSMLNLSVDSTEKFLHTAGDVIIVGLIISLLSSYQVNAKYFEYNNELTSLRKQLEEYEGGPENIGTIANLEKTIEDLKNGDLKNYYHIGEFLNSLASPLEIESIKINDKDIEIVAYADNLALIQQFLETVKARQFTNQYTKFSLSESDINTVFRDGKKMDKVIFTGRIH